MSEQKNPEPDYQEKKRLQDIIDSIPGKDEPLEEVLAAWQRGSDLYRVRRGLEYTPEKAAHEKNVTRFYKRALATHYVLQRRHCCLSAPWSLGAEFIAAHFGETPLQTLETVRYCLRPKTDGAKLTIVLTIMLPSWLLIRFANLSLLTSWILADFVVMSALIASAKSMRCSLIRRQVPEKEALEEYCDVIAGSAFRALPAPLWGVLPLMIVLTCFVCGVF